MTAPNLKNKIPTDLVESLFIAYMVNLTLTINKRFDNNVIEQDFSKFTSQFVRK